MPRNRHHPLVRALLLDPDRVQRHLDAIAASPRATPHLPGLGGELPNLWQISQGVLRMVHRIVFRFNSIGLSVDKPVRAGWSARLLQFRPVRAPFLFAVNALHPLDLSGLLSTPEDIADHLVGTHHDRHQFAYDLQILGALSPETLPLIRDRALRVISGEDPKARLYLDIVTFEGYHEALVESVEAAMRGEDLLTADEADDPDVSFWAWLRWCKAQPANPDATLRAWRAGEWAADTGLRTAGRAA
jgi:hypothetical protein